MPRPPRIEYEGGYYHVMNRGRGRRLIFYGNRYYQAFLDTITEVHQRYSVIVQAYCLMEIIPFYCTKRQKQILIE